MMEKRKISIIVPVYNVAPYLHQCMDSLVNQTYPHIEIVCVDDGSTDESGTILEEYAARDDRVKVIHQKNAGLSAARNTGFEKTVGECIMYVDSDDWIDLDTCQIAMDAMLAHNADIVFWSYIREFADKHMPKTFFHEKFIVFDGLSFFESVYKSIVGLHGEHLAHPENADTLVTAWGKLYKRKLIIQNNAHFIDTKEIGTEDALFNVSILKSVECGIYIGEYYSHYRKNNGTSLTATYKPSLQMQWKKLFQYIRGEISDSKYKKELLQSLNNRISLSVIGLGLNALSNPYKKEILSEIREILSDPEYRAAIRTLPMRYFPPHWWVFFACCKLRSAVGVYMLLKCMERMKS